MTKQKCPVFALSLLTRRPWCYAAADQICCAVVAAQLLQVSSLQRLPICVRLHKGEALCWSAGTKEPNINKSTTHNIPAAKGELSLWGKVRFECDGHLWGCVLERVHLLPRFLPVRSDFLCFHVGAATAWKLNCFELLLSFYPKTMPNNEVLLL